MARKAVLVASVLLAVGSVVLSGAGAISASPTSAKTQVPLGLKGISGLSKASIARWNRLVAEAQQEGKMTFLVSSDQTNAFYQAFGSEFGINVTIGTGSSTGLATRVLAERQQGLHLEDVIDAGTATAELLLQGNAFQPYFSNVILNADVNRSTGWYLKTIPYSPGDPVKKYCTYASMTPGSNLTFFYNTNLISAAQIKKINSWDDLLSPKYRGLWEMGNVADGVAANDRTLGWALLGKRYWQRFMANNPTVFAVGTDPLAVNALLRGQFAFAIFPGSGSPWHGAIAQGLNIAQFSKVLKPHAASVPGQSLCIFNNAPDQAAAQLFANWILTPEGQAAINLYSPEPGDVALRSTAPRGNVPGPLWQLAKRTRGVFVASNHPNDVNDSLTWWQGEMQKLGIH